MKKNLLKFEISALIGLIYLIPVIAAPDNRSVEDAKNSHIDEWATLLLLAGIGICIFVVILSKIKSAIDPD